MKIGIITIQKSEVNFGACLQCYALWRYICSCGYDCEIIDLLRPCHAAYEVSPSFDERKPSLGSRLNIWLHTLYHNKPSSNDIIRLEKFNSFNNQAKYSKTYNSVESLYKAELDYDVLVTGSDQVWNPFMPFLNAPYFLTFADNNFKKISYASSFGIDKLPDDVKKTYANWLEGYQHISTREGSGVEIVRNLIGTETVVALDPVFLLDKEEWRQMMIPCKNLKTDKFIFFYMLSYDEKIMTLVEKFARQKNLPLFVTLSENRTLKSKYARQISDIGPAEWLWLIDNATLLITTSFHGLAFAVMLNTPLAVIIKKDNPTNARIIDLCKNLDIMNHIYDAYTPCWKSDTDFSISKNLFAKLSDALESSKKYLSSAIAE